MELYNSKSDKRSCYVAELSSKDIGRRVTVAGFVQKQRDLGSLIFIDLRDRSGILQLAFDDATDREVFRKAFGVRSEYVLVAKGTVRSRAEGAHNASLKTGDIEIAVDELKILSAATTPPFELSGENDDRGDVREELRLKYRYIDLRRPQLQKNLYMRHQIAKVTRDYFYENGFWEIETPMLIKETPEGARDYLVPSRIHKGSFYALPQSPQIYKQLLMVAGYDRYIQLARCFRDEDLRADRQPEFTQIDLEMSFVDVDDVLEIIEGYMKRLFDEVMHISLEDHFPRMTYTEAMERYGSDKPDTRFGMEICNISDLVKDSEFSVFSDTVKNGGAVCGITVKNAADKLSRKEIDKQAEYAKGVGAKGLAYVRFHDKTPNCSFAKFMREGELEAILDRMDCREGDVALFIADKKRVTYPVLGLLRQKIAKQLDMIPEGFRFLWITEFPFFEWDEESESWVAMHHPFTMPEEKYLDTMTTDPGSVKAKAYDLVLNGIELSSGSIRITDSALQQKMFEALGLTDEEIKTKFGFLVDAYQYGAPPHGGCALGLDRLTMMMCGADSLRDVVAFPKVQNASELMSDCPAPANEKLLRELGIQMTKPKD